MTLFAMLGKAGLFSEFFSFGVGRKGGGGVDGFDIFVVYVYEVSVGRGC